MLSGQTLVGSRAAAGLASGRAAAVPACLAPRSRSSGSLSLGLSSRSWSSSSLALGSQQQKLSRAVGE